MMKRKEKGRVVNSRRNRKLNSSQKKAGNVQINFRNDDLGSFNNTPVKESSPENLPPKPVSRRGDRRVTSKHDKNHQPVGFSKEFGSFLDNQKIDLEESQFLDNNLNMPSMTNERDMELEMMDEPGDILDMEFNKTLKNLEKFNRTNFSRMLTS